MRPIDGFGPLFSGSTERRECSPFFFSCWIDYRGSPRGLGGLQNGVRLWNDLDSACFLPLARLLQHPIQRLLLFTLACGPVALLLGLTCVIHFFSTAPDSVDHCSFRSSCLQPLADSPNPGTRTSAHPAKAAIAHRWLDRHSRQHSRARFYATCSPRVARRGALEPQQPTDQAWPSRSNTDRCP